MQPVRGEDVELVLFFNGAQADASQERQDYAISGTRTLWERSQ
jgi:hypothetical protein